MRRMVVILFLLVQTGCADLYGPPVIDKEVFRPLGSGLPIYALRAEERYRRAVVYLRRSDGASDEEIGSELRSLDRTWFVDYVLFDRDLDKSTRRYMRALCQRGAKLAKGRRSRSAARKRLEKCEQKKAAELEKLEAAGIDWSDR